MGKPSSIMMISFAFVIAIAVLFHLNRKVEERQIPIKQTMAACIQWADLIAHNPGETGNLSEQDAWGVFLRKEISDVSYRVVSAGPDKKFGNKDDISESRAYMILSIEETNADTAAILPEEANAESELDRNEADVEANAESPLPSPEAKEDSDE